MKQKNIGILLSISIVAISFAAIFVKWSDAPSTVLSMYRMYFACVLLIPIVWVNRAQFKKLTLNEWIFLALSGACLGLHFALWFGSLKLTTVASSTIILALQPIFALIGGFFFYKERVGVGTLVTIGIAVIGVAMIGWGDLGGHSRDAIIGDILSVLCVIAVVGYLLIGQNKVKNMSHWIYSFLVFFFAGFFLHMFNLATDIAVTGYAPKEWGIFLLLAIFPTVAHVIFNFLLSYVNSTTISMSVLGEPVGATILAVILLGERLTLLQFLGGLLVLSGVMVFLLKQGKPKQIKEASDFTNN